ncbi:hypothetical protein K469DRAFT_707239 [Zopfia rhizophila CBS 207.26]|uniref:Uncharacterized protein n=1 Tax=Zopfia rhizophila CBS 207.26 TaxID=1314779 RepID=A0A6A6E894_9PEZI|nr:hypothetical protein K469DRAFT_707239 [Zopfia rhizophila CBS 207.26]
MRIDILVTFALAGIVAAKGSKPPKSQKPDPPKSSKAPDPPKSSKAPEPPKTSAPPPPPPSSKAAPPPSSSAKRSSTIVVVTSSSKSSAAPSSSSNAASSKASSSAASSSKASASSSVASSSVSASSSASATRSASGSVSATGSASATGSVSSTRSASSDTASITATTSVSSTGSSTSSSVSSTASSDSCFVKDYKPRYDPGPKEDPVEQKRSIAGRIEIERRANERAPEKFGSCDITAKLGSKLTLRGNPNVNAVLNNAKSSGGGKDTSLAAIPRWYNIKDACNANPAFEKVGDGNPTDLNSKIDMVTPRGSAIKVPKYNVDHVWELALMVRYFESFLPGGASTSNELECKDFEASFFIDGKKKEEQPIQELYALMPQARAQANKGEDTQEFAGIGYQLNGKKARILTPDSLGRKEHMDTMQNVKDKIDGVRAVSIAMAVLNDGEVVKLFDRAQARLHKYLVSVDDRIAKDSIALKKADFKYADKFVEFMKKFLDERSDETWKWVDKMMNDIDSDIKKMRESSAAEKKRKDDHKAWYDILKKSSYTKKAHYDIKWNPSA